MKSIGQKIRQLAGLLGTKDITPWEEKFITSMLDVTNDGAMTTILTTKQVDTVESIFDKHYVA